MMRVILTGLKFHVSDISVDPDDARSDDGPNLNFRMKALESIQYQAALAISGAWKGTSTKKIYERLGRVSLHQRRCFRRIIRFYKIMNDLTPCHGGTSLDATQQMIYTNIYKYFILTLLFVGMN